MSAVQLLPAGSWLLGEVIFAFDATTSISRDDSYKATKYAIESGEEIADYLIELPHKYTVSGIISAAAITGTQTPNTRLGEIHEQLITRAQLRQPVTLVSPEWIEDVVIVKLTSKHDTEGEFLAISMQLQSYDVATFQTAEIPAELLADSIKDDATEDPGEGGAGAADEVDDDEPGEDAEAKSWGATSWDFMGDYFD